jgi:hypothetical protein
MIKRTCGQMIGLVLALVLTGCATLEDIIYRDTRVDYKKGYDFDHIRKLAIAPCGYSGYRPAVLTEVQSTQVNQAISRALEKQGMEIVEGLEEADAVVDWHVVTEEKSNVRSYNAQSYYQCWRCGPAISDREVKNYTMGTFIIDIIDPGLGKSVWRGVMQGRLADIADIPVQQATINAAAEEVFARFPPGILIHGIY